MHPHQIVAEGLKFPEGPIAMDDGSVIFVEIAAGKLTRLAPDGAMTTVATPGGGQGVATILRQAFRSVGFGFHSE